MLGATAVNEWSVRVDPHQPCRLGRPKPHREDGPEHDRHLAEDVAGDPLANHPLDPVSRLDRLDAPVEHGENRPFVTLLRRVLAAGEAEIGRCTRELLALGRGER